MSAECHMSHVTLIYGICVWRKREKGVKSMSKGSKQKGNKKRHNNAFFNSL